MSDALAAAPASKPISARPKRGASTGDAIFALVAKGSGLLVLVLLGAIIVTLFVGGLPAFRQFGLHFLVDTDWDPVQDVYGGAVAIYGTLITSVIALVMAVPISFGIAVFLTELAPA